MELLIPKRYLGKLLNMIGMTVTIICFVLVMLFRINLRQLIDMYYIVFLLFFLAGFCYGKQFILCPYFWFLMFYLLYATVYPIVYEFGNITLYSLKGDTILYTCSYCFKSACIIIMFFHFNMDRCVKIKKIDQSFLRGHVKGMEFFCIFLLSLEILYFLTCGYLSFFLSGTTRRTDINIYLKYANIWTFLGYYTIFTLLYLRMQRNLKIMQRFIILLPSCFYYFVSIFSGSRKQLLFVTIMVLITSCFSVMGRSRRKTKLLLIFLGIVLICAVYIRVIIMDKGGTGNIYHKVYSFGGEFIYPSITFPITIQKKMLKNAFQYPTLFDSVLYFIPRFLFPFKNHSIGDVFARSMNINMGFAMSPMLEAYINFGNIGYLLEAVIIIFILQISHTCIKKNILIYIYSIIFLIDLNRGEISFYIRQMIEVYMFIYSVEVMMKKVRWRK